MRKFSYKKFGARNKNNQNSHLSPFSTSVFKYACHIRETFKFSKHNKIENVYRVSIKL